MFKVSSSGTVQAHRLLEDVDTHGGDVGELLGALGVEAEDGGVHLHSLELVTGGLLREVDNASGAVNLHQTESGGALLVHGHGTHLHRSQFPQVPSFSFKLEGSVGYVGNPLE